MNNQTEQIYLLNPTGGQSSGLLQRIAENSSANQVNLENVEDFSKVCRTCATITDQVVPVFSGEGLQNNLAEKINKHLPIQICAWDELPVGVCVQCAHTVLAWHELAQCCAQADTALRTRLQQLKAAPQAQDRKPTRNATGQFMDQQNELQEARLPPPEYPRTNNKPLLQRCKYCPAQETADKYKAHLEDEHLDLVFYCDECNSFVDRMDFILHMSLHIFQNTVQAEMKERAQEREKGQGNAEAAPKQNSSANNSKLETAANKTPAHKKVGTRRNSKIKNKLIDSKRVVKTERSTRNIKNEARSVANDTPEQTVAKQPTETVTEALSPKMQTEVASSALNTNNNQNMFSDHSDTEDFGSLPLSVFQAIEDTQDGQSFNTTNTNGTEPQHQDSNTSDSESDNESLEEKAKKNSNKKTRVCPICSKEYTASSSYFYHIKYSHKGVRDHECEICGRKFVTRNCLTQHMNTHSEHCNFECKVCKKKFRTNASLYIHEQSHNGVKTYNCSRCDVSFRWRTHLMRHVKRHKADKAHVCETCGRGFTIHCDLLRHKRTHEAGNYKCAQCGVKFAQARYLKVHMDKKHVSVNPVTEK